MAEDNNQPVDNANAETANATTDWKARYEEALAHSREWEKRAKANKCAADELAALKESQLTETEKLTKRAQDAEKKLAELQHTNDVNGWRENAAREFHLPAELISGDSEDAIKANAKALADYVKSLTKPAAPAVANAAHTPADHTNPNRQLLAQLFGK